MNWTDICGPPGSGKSTLCDPLWHPHSIVTDHKLPPVQWQDFLNEITRLFGLLQDHESFIAAVRMNRRSMRKMSAVARMDGGPYIQTGFAQRGLGFGWRLTDSKIDINELRHFFRLMPVSIGVALVRTSIEETTERNKNRELVKETAHENRSFMVSLMQPAIELMLEVLRERAIPVAEIDSSRSIDESRQQLIDFTNRGLAYAEKVRPDYQVEVLSGPVWW